MSHWQRAHPVARKEHVCGSCRRIIRPGETYMRGSGMDGGTAWTWKECAHCEAFLALLQARWDDDEYAPDALFEFEPQSPAEARVAALLRMRWQRRDGTLYPVPILDYETTTYHGGEFVLHHPVSIRAGERKNKETTDA